jgi:hypothetical protein
MKEIKTTLLCIFLLTIYQIHGQEKIENRKSQNNESHYEKYQKYYHFFISYEKEIDTISKKSFSDSILYVSLHLSREEQNIFFSNSITDTILKPETKMFMLILSAGIEYPYFAYLKYELDSTIMQNFDEYLSMNFMKNNEITHCNFDSLNYSNENKGFFTLKKYVSLKYQLISQYEFEKYKLNCTKVDDLFKYNIHQN